MFSLAPVLWMHNNVLHFPGFFKFCLRSKLIRTKFYFPASWIRWWSVIYMKTKQKNRLFSVKFTVFAAQYRALSALVSKQLPGEKKGFRYKDVFIDVPVKQWQAVKIQLDLMSEPPHTWVLSSNRAACHGHALSLLTLPPTIRLLITWDLVHALPYRLVCGRRNRFPHDWKSLTESNNAFKTLIFPMNKI